MTLTEPMKASPDTFAGAHGRGSPFQPGSLCRWGGTWEGHLDIKRQNLPKNKANPNERKSKKQNDGLW